MATWPANGDTDWNTKMLAYLAVGHDTDGTHGKTQMLTDMGWSPTSYAGGETTTLPNGLILKFGVVTAITAGTAVAFGTAFPVGAIAAFACPNNTDNLTQSTGYSGKASVDTLTTAGMNVSCDGSAYWLAIGY